MHNSTQVYRLISLGMTILYGLLSACEKELDLDLPVTPSKLVVEGWIENGKKAQVVLSHSASYFSVIDSTTLPDFAETHAKVTLFSLSDQEILTLKPNQAYFPPFVYKSVALEGEAGQRYVLEVILNGDTIRGTTTIPEPVELDSVWFALNQGMESKGSLWIRLTDNPDEENFYRVLYKRKGKDSTFVSPNLSTFSDAMFNGETLDISFRRGYSSMIAVEEDQFFSPGDTVSVKFCSIDREQFDFWNVYQNEVLSAANPLSTSNNQLKSNMEGGLGVWSGYGATYYVVYAE